MKTKKIKQQTTSRKVFNRVYKMMLERTGYIHCSGCGYHRGENTTNKYYYVDDDKSKFPSWKLETKNKKQWMVKNRKMKEHTYIKRGVRKKWHVIQI